MHFARLPTHCQKDEESIRDNYVFVAWRWTVLVQDDPSSLSGDSASVLAASLCAVRAELLAILNELRWLTGKLKDDAEDGSVTSDWKFVAMVVDRLCFWVFTLYYVVGSVAIFFRAPNIVA